MADDIVNQLRNAEHEFCDGPYATNDPDLRHDWLLSEAAHEIEQLRAEVERLIPFARLIAHAEPYTTIPMDPDDVLWDRVHPTVQEAADARTAVAAYEAARKEADRG